MSRTTRILVAALISIVPAVALRWSYPILFSFVTGAIDLTTVLFLTPLVLGVVGLPGYVLAVIERFEFVAGMRDRLWIRASLLAELTAALALVLLWIVSSTPILTTLSPLSYV